MCKSVYPSYIYPFFFVDLEINHPQASNCSLNSNALTKNEKQYMGVSLNGDIPKTPQNDHFS